VTAQPEPTVRGVSAGVRKLGLTTVFRNPGPTEARSSWPRDRLAGKGPAVDAIAAEVTATWDRKGPTVLEILALAGSATTLALLGTRASDDQPVAAPAAITA
jgi:hypothetical protein